MGDMTDLIMERHDQARSELLFEALTKTRRPDPVTHPIVSIPDTDHMALTVQTSVEQGMWPGMRFNLHIFEPHGTLHSSIGSTVGLGAEGVRALRDECERWLVEKAAT